MDIKEVTLIKGCFGEDVIVDGVNLNDIPKEKVLEWMIEKIKTCQHYSFLETFKNFIWMDYHDADHVYNDKCDQCGDWNSKVILKLKEE